MICDLRRGDVVIDTADGWLVVPLGGKVVFALPEWDAPSALALTSATGTETVHQGELSSGQWTCAVVFSQPGLTALRLLSKSGRELASSEPAYILVQPKWVEEMRLLTVLPRNLGNFQTWEEQLRAQGELGYNAVHFAPLQTQYRYQSHYGLADHLALNPDFFPGLGNHSERQNALRQLVTNLHQSGIRCVQDIVLNHASAACSLFASSSEAAYTRENSPHLASALELDLALQRFSAELATEAASDWYPFGTQVSSKKHIDAVMEYIEKTLLPELKLEEYYLLNEKEEVVRILSAPGKPKRKLTNAVDIEAARMCVKEVGLRRWGARLDKTLLAKDVSLDTLNEADATLLVKGVNSILKEEFAELFTEILKNIRIAIHHLKIAENQPEITAESPLLKPYFVLLPTGEYAALNGFVVDNPDVRLDITREDSWNYLRRAVFPWRDCVKLRYQQQPSDSFILWDYMTAYVRDVAETFAGIRVDNAHGTPLHVLKYMTQVAKRQNPDVVVMAELYAQTVQQEKDFFACGIDLVLRESADRKSMKSLAELIRQVSKPGLNTIPRAHINLPIEPLPALLFDCTHDNEALATSSTLPRAAAVAFARCAVGSTRGVDDFLKKKVSVVGEHRRYPLTDCSDLQKFSDADNLVVLMYRTTETAWNVQVKGSWNNWSGGVLLEKWGSGVYGTTLSVPERKDFEYFFMVDGDEKVSPFAMKSSGGKNFYHFESVPRAVAGFGTSLAPVRKLLSHLHETMGQSGFSHADAMAVGEDVIMVFRCNTVTRMTYVLVAREGQTEDPTPCTVSLPGRVKEFLFVAELIPDTASAPMDEETLSTEKGKLVFFPDVGALASIQEDYFTSCDNLVFSHVPASFAVALKVQFVN